MTRAVAIVSPPYRENSGGRVVLHKLCAELREGGYAAYMVPWRASVEDFEAAAKDASHMRLPTVRKNPEKNDFVLYPDIVAGNPFAAEDVIRWQLYKPRHRASPKDHVFYFTSQFGPGPYLTVIDPRLDLFHDRGEPRAGTCWVWRKADRQGWECHDAAKVTERYEELPRGMRLAELADAFNRFERFVCFDNATYMAIQAQLCGCAVEIRTKDRMSPMLEPLARETPAQTRKRITLQQDRQRFDVHAWAKALGVARE